MVFAEIQGNAFSSLSPIFVKLLLTVLQLQNGFLFPSIEKIIAIIKLSHSFVYLITTVAIRPVAATTHGLGQEKAEGLNGFIVVCNPENKYGEYVIVSPDKYREELTYLDYLKIYKPIVVSELETNSNVHTS